MTNPATQYYDLQQNQRTLDTIVNSLKSIADSLIRDQGTRSAPPLLPIENTPAPLAQPGGSSAPRSANTPPEFPLFEGSGFDQSGDDDRDLEFRVQVPARQQKSAVVKKPTQELETRPKGGSTECHVFISFVTSGLACLKVERDTAQKLWKILPACEKKVFNDLLLEYRAVKGRKKEFFKKKLDMPELQSAASCAKYLLEDLESKGPGAEAGLQVAIRKRKVSIAVDSDDDDDDESESEPIAKTKKPRTVSLEDFIQDDEDSIVGEESYSGDSDGSEKGSGTSRGKNEDRGKCKRATFGSFPLDLEKYIEAKNPGDTDPIDNALNDLRLGINLFGAGNEGVYESLDRMAAKDELQFQLQPAHREICFLCRKPHECAYSATKKLKGSISVEWNCGSYCVQRFRALVEYHKLTEYLDNLRLAMHGYDIADVVNRFREHKKAIVAYIEKIERK